MLSRNCAAAAAADNLAIQSFGQRAAPSARGLSIVSSVRVVLQLTRLGTPKPIPAPCSTSSSLPQGNIKVTITELVLRDYDSGSLKGIFANVEFCDGDGAKNQVR